MNTRNSEAFLRIGTSGWHYKHWLDDFYPPRLPASEMFCWYAKHFDTVEINNTFYRLPAEGALVRWRDLAPPKFLFSVKASRFITHMKRLLDPETTIENFLSRVELLGPHLGPILFQFPAQWACNVARLEAFLEALPPTHQYVFEFRHASWSNEPVYEVLRHHNAALCMHDWEGAEWPLELTANFSYLRFHGPARRYAGSYSPAQLRTWADRILQWEESLQQVFVYFNNDTGGDAIRNALTLRKILRERVQKKVA